MTTPYAYLTIVDSRPADYAEVVRHLGGQLKAVRFYRSSREALRCEAIENTQLCLVAAALPRISGIDLLEMLRPRLAEVPCGLVDERYSVERECLARQLGADFYLCKPLEADTFDAWFVDNAGTLARSSAFCP